jgi:hypothetical protein
MLDASEALNAARPQRWWHWLLLYPTAAVALFSAAPQWIDRGLAAWHGTRSDSYLVAERQSELWRKNLSCSASPFSWYENPRNMRVDATICESGDVFVRVSTPDNRNFFEWVDVDAVVHGQPGPGVSLIPEAHAATISTPIGPATLTSRLTGASLFRAHYQPTAMIVCQRFLDQRRLLRHVRTPAGCFDEIIDTLNGAVIQRTQVPCRNGC